MRGVGGKRPRRVDPLLSEGQRCALLLAQPRGMSDLLPPPPLRLAAACQEHNFLLSSAKARNETTGSGVYPEAAPRAARAAVF